MSCPKFLLMCAAKCGNIEVMRSLLKKGEVKISDVVKKAKVMPRDSMVTMVHYDSYGQLLLVHAHQPLAEPVTTVNLGKRWKLDHQRNVRYRFELCLTL